MHVSSVSPPLRPATHSWMQALLPYPSLGPTHRNHRHTRFHPYWLPHVLFRALEQFLLHVLDIRDYLDSDRFVQVFIYTLACLFLSFLTPPLSLSPSLSLPLSLLLSLSLRRGEWLIADGLRGPPLHVIEYTPFCSDFGGNGTFYCQLTSIVASSSAFVYPFFCLLSIFAMCLGGSILWQVHFDPATEERKGSTVTQEPAAQGLN